MNPARFTSEPTRYALRPHEPIFFLHIPKTGGMTLKEVLKSVVGASHFCQIPIRKFADLRSDHLTRFTCIRAHWDYSFFRMLPRKPVYITMLRHPFSLMLSMVAMHQRTRKRPELDVSSLQALVNSLPPARRNPLTYYLAGGIQNAAALSGEAALEVALTRLDEFAFFGLVSRFDESVRLLCHTFGWSTPPRIEMRNAADPRAKPALSAEDRAFLQESARFDVRLYAEASALFEQRLAQIGAP